MESDILTKANDPKGGYANPKGGCADPKESGYCAEPVEPAEPAASLSPLQIRAAAEAATPTPSKKRSAEEMAANLEEEPPTKRPRVPAPESPGKSDLEEEQEEQEEQAELGEHNEELDGKGNDENETVDTKDENDTADEPSTSATSKTRNQSQDAASRKSVGGWQAMPLEPGDHILFTCLLRRRLYDGIIVRVNREGVARVVSVVGFAKSARTKTPVGYDRVEREFFLDLVNGTTHRINRVFRPEFDQDLRHGSFLMFDGREDLWLQRGDVFSIYVQGAPVEVGPDGDTRRIQRSAATVLAIVRNQAEISYKVDPALMPPSWHRAHIASKHSNPCGQSKSDSSGVLVYDLVPRNTLRFDKFIHRETPIASGVHFHWKPARPSTFSAKLK